MDAIANKTIQGRKRGNMKKLDEAIERFNHNAEYERTHGNLQGYLEFRQLSKWLKELKVYREMYHKEHAGDYLRSEGEDKELRTMKRTPIVGMR